MKELKGFIFDIQGYSTHDGPGCRTLVFFKGCPLKCSWCSNPESWDFKANPLYRETKCILGKRNCSRCIDACPHKAIRFGNADAKEPTLVLDRSYCGTCQELACAEACLDEAIMVCGKWYTPQDLLKVLNRDRDYWVSGGVTFTGGEPLSQPEFLKAVLRLCRAERIHTAIETAAYQQTDIFMDCVELLDFAFIDLKHMNDEKHKLYTGLSNELIKKNIATLAAATKTARWPGRMVIRMPIIAGFNDDLDNAREMAEFLNKIGQMEVNLLPFHPLGESKWRQLGTEYDFANQTGTPEEVLAGLQEVFLQRDILCYVSSDTPF